jgi:8-oxo-dGTP pyrophosphatase MutT (NUDIX family)
VVLARGARPDAAPEILLMQRKASAGWLGGAWVFPGGRVDDGDREPAWDGLCLGTATLAEAWPEVDPAWLRDHAVAAVREVFEETGALIAETVTQRHADAPLVHGPVGRTSAERRTLLDGLSSFARACAHRHWRLRLDQLVPFARWITPEQERRRFDTVFFLATAPRAELDHHEHEMSAHAWVTARKALSRFARREVELAPPTLRTLEDLGRARTLDELFEWARTVPRRVVAPRFHEDASGRWLLLPGDPLYPAPATGPVPPPTRFLFEDGRWRSAPAP